MSASPWTDLMVDIETLGKRPGCVVTAIGAVAFCAERGGIGPSFETRPDVVAQMNAGLGVDGETMLWWMRQSESARSAWASEEAQDGARMPSEALAALVGFVREVRPARVWANSPSFDLVILAALFERARMMVPWDYRQERDVRTIGGLVPSVGKVIPTVAHSAVADAEAQAKYVTACWAALRPV